MARAIFEWWEGPWFPDLEVFDIEEETHSSLLGPDGKPIPYKPQGMGFIGFVRLKEAPRDEAPHSRTPAPR